MSAKKETTHIISQGELIVYRRERSSIWQCRFKVGGIWQRASTKQRKLADAIAEAKELRITAEIRKRNNLPVVTRKFRHVAKLAMDRLQTQLNSGQGKVSYKDYIRITNEYLIPILGNRLINSIDHAALEYLDQRRTELMGHAPSKSTLLSQNAALNCIFDEAIQRNFITELNRPKLSTAFQKMLEVYLRDHNLLFDPKSDTNRVFYSFRHTYATLALTYDKVPIHTLAKQMGTSVPMIEKHYSHLEVLKAVEQLSGVESRKRIANTSTISKVYAFNGRANSKPQPKPANT